MEFLDLINKKIEERVDDEGQISFWLHEEGEIENPEFILFSYPKGVVPDKYDGQFLNKEIALSKRIFRDLVLGRAEEYLKN